MAFAVTTYSSPDDLAAALQATVTVHSSEQSLSDAIDLAVDITTVVSNGQYYTLIDDASVTNVSLRVVSKNIKYTVILETA